MFHALALWLTVFLLAAQPPEGAVAPASQPASSPKRRVLIISVDGLRPDIMLRADAPVMKGLMESGAFTCWAQTTAVAVTLPSHVSMLTGFRPQKHQIEWNHDLPLSEDVYPKVPTIFELARKAGYSTALVAGKDKFSILNKPGTIDFVSVTAEPVVPDARVAREALKIIEQNSPEVMFVHFPQVDATGHAKGWGSPEQIKAIAGADKAIGELLDALRKRGTFEATMIIVSADHGGAGITHGADDPRSRHIPWIVVGPGVRKGYDLTRDAQLTVRTEDTCATACRWLGIELPSQADGKPVAEIYPPAAASEAKP